MTEIVRRAGVPGGRSGITRGRTLTTRRMGSLPAGAGTGYRQLVLATVPNLVAYWPMDNEEGEFTDQVGTADVTDAVSSGSASAYPGVGGGSRDFPGTGRATAALALDAAMVLGCLFKADVTTGYLALHGRWAGNNGLILALDTNRVSGAFGAAGLVGATTVGTGWHFAMFSSGPIDRRRVWLDGAVDGADPSSSGHGTTGGTAWEIGAYANNAAGQLDGLIAHVWVASGELDATAGTAVAQTLSLL